MCGVERWPAKSAPFQHQFNSQLAAFIRDFYPVLSGIKVAMPSELWFVCWQIPRIHPGWEKLAINWFLTPFWNYLNPNLPKHFPPFPALGFKAHMKNFSTQRLCVISACLCSLLELRRGLRHQIRAVDLPGKSPVGKGAQCCCLRGLFGFIRSTDTFCVQTHLSHQNRGIEEHHGSTATNIPGKQLPEVHWNISRFLFVFGWFWQTLTCPPAGLCCSEGWVAKGQQIHWPDWNNSGLKATKILFFVPCCPSSAPEAESSHPAGHCQLGWAGMGGLLISWEGEPGPSPWNRADLLGLPRSFNHPVFSPSKPWVQLVWLWFWVLFSCFLASQSCKSVPLLQDKQRWTLCLGCCCRGHYGELEVIHYFKTSGPIPQAWEEFWALCLLYPNLWWFPRMQNWARGTSGCARRG